MGALWLVAAALAAAAPPTGNAAVDAFVADLAAGRRDSALARIFEMNSISGRPNAVALAGEFVDKLLRCTLVSSQPRAFSGEMYNTRWRCPDGDYYALLDPTYRPPRLVVAEFLSARTRDQRRSEPPMAPPLPPVLNGPALSDDETVRIVARYLDGIRLGGSADSASITFRLHFLDRRQPDSFVGPEQLGRYLGACRARGEPRLARGGLFDGGVIVRWACASRGALHAELATVMTLSRGRVIAGMVLVGQAPDPPPGEPPRP
jgi:hypothetical protein